MRLKDGRELCKLSIISALGCLFLGLSCLEGFFEEDCCEAGEGAAFSIGLSLKLFLELRIDNYLDCGQRRHNENILA